MILIWILVLFASSCSIRPDTEKEQIGPNISASLVIYFRSDATEDEVDRLAENIIYADRSDGRGKRILHNVRTFLRLLPSQANGHEALALTFQPTASEADLSAVRGAFAQSPLVLRIFENIAPDKVRPEDLPSD